MRFNSPLDETLFVAEIVPERKYMFQHDLKTGLSVIWNTGHTASFMIDREVIELETDSVIFLTEFHQIDTFRFERMNVLQFNRPFYCVEKHDTEVGCRGVLFFGAAQIPKILIPRAHKKQFKLLWEILMMEMEESDLLKLDMLRILLKRFLILCLRIYTQSAQHLPADSVSVGLIREYNYLVEQHYQNKTQVSDYARMLHKSAKTLAHIFKQYSDKTPLQIIQDRRLLEARRLLAYAELDIQQIAEQLSFADLQAFSHFFRSRMGISPSSFRKKAREDLRP